MYKLPVKGTLALVSISIDFYSIFNPTGVPLKRYDIASREGLQEPLGLLSKQLLTKFTFKGLLNVT